MKKLLTIVCILFVYGQIQAQEIDSLNIDAHPIGGTNALALEYYRIEFSKEQRAQFKDVTLELIYNIETDGTPTLEEVNGVTDPIIIDSLMSRTPYLPTFVPQMVNGVNVSSLYFMRFSFPTYQKTNNNRVLNQAYFFKVATNDDFEEYKLSEWEFHMLFSGLASVPLGGLSDYLKTGGGIKMDFLLNPGNSTIFGLNIGFSTNKTKAPYPIETHGREQFTSLATAFLGGNIGKRFKRFYVTAELDFVFQNLTEKLGNSDDDWLQIRGFSPALTFNFPIRIGKDKLSYAYNNRQNSNPILGRNFINVYLGIRPVLYKFKEASGVFLEFGVGYNLSFTKITDYKLKESFFEN